MSALQCSGQGVGVREQDRIRPWQTGGTERSAPLPSNHLAASHTARPLRTCSASTKGSSGKMAEGSSRTTSGSRESERAESWSSVELREPERCLRGLLAQVGERHFERCRASDQYHVISYSQAGQRRIRAEQLFSGQLSDTAPGSVARDRALDGSAHCHPDAARIGRAGNGKGDEGPSAVEPLAGKCGLELRLPAEPVTPLHRERRSRRLVAGDPCDGDSAQPGPRPVRSCGAKNRARGGGTASSVERFA